MMKQVSMLYLFCLLVGLGSVQGQTKLPKRPNKTNANGLKKGKWIILYDKNWKVTLERSKTAYYRLLTYKNGKPIGKVKDYYKSGVLQSAIDQLTSENPDKMEGKVVFYHYNGKKHYEAFYKNGAITEIKYYNQDGSIAQPSWALYAQQAVQLYNAQKWASAIKMFERARVQSLQEFPANSENTANALYHLGLIQFVHKNYQAADSLLAKAIAIFDKAYITTEYTTYGTACFYMGQLKNYLKQGNQATPFFEKATAIYKDVFGAQNISYATAAHELANLYGNQGKYAQAKALCEIVKPIYEAHPQLGKQHIKYAMINFQLGNSYYGLGNYKEAITLYKSVYSVYEKTYGKTHLQYATLLVNWANAYRDQQEFKKAKPLYQESIQALEKMKDTYPLYYAGAVQNFARLYYEQSQYSESESKYKLVLNIYETSKATNDIGYLECLNSLGDVYVAKANYGKAKQHYDKLQQLSKTILPSNHAKLLEYSNSLAILYSTQGKHQQAAKVYALIIAQAKKTTDLPPLNYAVYLGNQAENYITTGAYGQAKASLDKSIQIHEQNNLHETPKYAIALLNLALLYQNQGKYKEALEIYKKTGNILKESLGKKHSVYHQYSNNLGRFYTELGKYQEAKWVLNRTIKELTETADTNNSVYVSAIEGLAYLYQTQNLYEQSEQLHKKVLKQREISLGKQHPKYADALRGIGDLYQQRGAYIEAELYYEQGIEILKKQGVTTNKVYLQLMLQVGDLYLKQKKFSQAEKLYRELKDVSEENQLTQSKEYLTTIYFLSYTYILQKELDKAKELMQQSMMQLDNISEADKTGMLILQGDLYREESNYKQALKAYKQAKEVATKAFGNTNTQYAQVLTNLGLLYIELDKNKKAIHWFNKASKIYEEKLGKNHILFLQVETYIAQCYAFLGRFDKATKSLSSLGEDWLASLQRTSRYMNEKTKKKYFQDLNDVFSVFQGLILAKRKQVDTVFVSSAFNLRLGMKAFLLNDVQKIQRLAAANIDTLVSKQYAKYTSLKAQVATGITLNREEQKQRGIDIQKTIEQVQKLEKELSLKVGVNTSNEQRIKFEDIRKALKPDEAAIMILPYKYLKPKTQKEEEKEETFSFFLLVTAKTNYPKLKIMQYKTATPQAFIKQYQKAIQAKQRDTLSYKVFWSPIDSLLKGKGIKKVYLSPDGVYHQLNLNTLQNPVTGKYVGEDVELHLVNSLKDIVKFKNQKTSVQANNHIQLFARPAYDLPIEDLKQAETALNTQVISSNTTTPLSAQEYQSGKQTLRSGWSDLPGTEAEIRAIEKVLLEQKKYQVVTRLKEQALEKAVKNVASPKVLHIATHGFFVENFKAPTKVQKEEVVFDNFSRGGTAMNMTALRAKITREEPMLRSGLVLAGASSYEKAVRKPNTEDGILTAYEASALDLQNTDLVTLSACETGLGEIENGEGVYGLQRAFMVAGAKSLLMSLWKVDDTATQLLMSRFYQEWIGKGKSKRAAFRAAQTYLRNYKKAGKKIYEAPYYWGAFVMVGE